MSLNFWQKTKLVFSNNFDDIIRRFLTGEDTTPAIGGVGPINSTTAMKYTAVFSCLRVLGETMASVPVMLYKKEPGGDRKAVQDLPIYDILHNRPNDEMSPFNFKEMCMNSLNLGGNSVCERLVDRSGNLVGLYPYQWQQVEISRNKDTKKLEYKIRGSDATVGKTLSRDQVFHIPGVSLDGVVGMSPISYAASAIRLGLSYEQFGVNLYKNGAFPSGAFSFDGVLNDEGYQRLKKDLKENIQGMVNVGNPLLLEQNGKFQQFVINPADAQLIENKRFQIEDIARIFRMPMHLIQELTRSTNNNIEQQSLEFVMYTMLPWFKRWEENIKMQLLTPEQRQAGYYVEFKMDGLLRGDTKTRAASYSLGRQWGWLSVNDIRRLENMSPIDNGDVYLEPLNMKEAGAEDPMKILGEEATKILNERGQPG